MYIWMFVREPVNKQEKVIWEYIYFRVIFQYQYHCLKNPCQNCMTACLYSSYTKYLFKTFLWVGGVTFKYVNLLACMFCYNYRMT